MSTLPRSVRLPVGLYALCEESIRPERSIVEKAQGCLAGGVRVLQLRMKNATPREALSAIHAIVPLCRASGAFCLVNDRVDLALIAEADGVHLGDDDLPLEDARAVLGPRAIIGRTARSLEEVRRAERAGADYAGVGPVFLTRTKHVDHPPLGLTALQSIVAGATIPVVAISGIDLANIADVAATGVHGAAVASDLLAADDVAERAQLLAAAFDSGRSRRSMRDRSR